MPEKRMRLKIPKSRFQSWHLLCCRANITDIENKRSKIKRTSTIKVSVRQGRETWRARVEVCGRVACRHSFCLVEGTPGRRAASIQVGLVSVQGRTTISWRGVDR